MNLNDWVGSFRSVFWGLAILALAGCDNDPYSGFGSSCTEGHPAVARARSLSETQLSFLYAEVYRLRDKNGPMGVEYGSFGAEIPENLQFLQALRIRPNDPDPNIMLAGCMDEYIYLEFQGRSDEEPGISLSWAAGTSENPYNTERETLWRAER